MKKEMSFQGINKEIKLKAVDFFCGAGGVTNGLIQAGISVLGGVDNAEDCKQTYEKNNKVTYLLRDITKLQPNDLTSKLGINRKDNKLIFVGCSPCQFWSQVRTQKKQEQQGAYLLKEFERLVVDFLPGYIVLENVPGLLRNKRSYLPTFLKKIKQLGYAYKGDVIDASKFEVPQRRTRYLLIASRVQKSVSLPPEVEGIRTVRDAIGDKNIFKRISAGHRDDSEWMHTTGALSNKNLQRIKLTPHDGGDRSSWSKTSLQIPAYKGKDNIFQDVYGRMFWDKVAPTITTKFNSLSNGRFGHPDEDRALSLREGATLQTFPKDYVFYSSSTKSIAKQIGNAVPPLLAKKVGEHIIRMDKNGQV